MSSPESGNEDGRVVDIQCQALDDLGLEEFVDFVRTPRRSFDVEIE
jgi:hypothetical protein